MWILEMFIRRMKNIDDEKLLVLVKKKSGSPKWYHILPIWTISTNSASKQPRDVTKR